MNRNNEINVQASVAAFSINNSKLVVGAVEAGSTFTLPTIAGLKDPEVRRAVFDDQHLEFLTPQSARDGHKTSLEPLVWQMETRIIPEKSTLQIGYLAISPLIALKTANLYPISVDTVRSFPSRGTGIHDQDLVERALQNIRFLSTLLSHIAEPQKYALQILARFIPNPRSFTITDLRQAHDAINQAVGDKPNNAANFDRWARKTDIQKTGELRTKGVGEPATLWRMPSSIVP